MRRLLVILTVALVSLATLVLAACGSNAGAYPVTGEAGPPPLPESKCAAGFIGDPAKEPVLELRALRANGTDVALNEGDDLAVAFPPQGGRVAFVGVRAMNIDGCGLQITGALRDPISKEIRLDGRTVNLRREADGWGTTGQGAAADLASSQAIGDYSNIPLCPNQWASQDVDDNVFELEVSVQDARKKAAAVTIHVTPRCAEPGEKEISCRCLCKQGYVLGESCGDDAGVPDGGTG